MLILHNHHSSDQYCVFSSYLLKGILHRDVGYHKQLWYQIKNLLRAKQIWNKVILKFQILYTWYFARTDRVLIPLVEICFTYHHCITLFYQTNNKHWEKTVQTNLFWLQLTKLTRYRIIARIYIIILEGWKRDNTTEWRKKSMIHM